MCRAYFDEIRQIQFRLDRYGPVSTLERNHVEALERSLLEARERQLLEARRRVERRLARSGIDTQQTDTAWLAMQFATETMPIAEHDSGVELVDAQLDERRRNQHQGFLARNVQLLRRRFNERIHSTSTYIGQAVERFEGPYDSEREARLYELYIRSELETSQVERFAALFRAGQV